MCRGLARVSVQWLETTIDEYGRDDYRKNAAIWRSQPLE